VQVADPVPGGTFAVSAPVRGADLRSRPRLAFDYALPADVRVDVYAVVAGQKYRLRLSGPEAGPLGVEELGAVPGATPDGKWHHAEVDLLGLLRPFFAPGAALVLDDLRFANYSPADYLLAGIGGNAQGAMYRLGGLSLGPGSSQPPAAVSRATAPPATVPAVCRCSFEEDLGRFRPWGVDAGATLRRARTPVAGSPQGGNWCLEVRNCRLGGLFGLEVGCTPFEASGCPILRFDYCVPDTLRVDLILEVAGSRRTIKFTDNDATWPVIGRVAVVPDGQWHHAEVDLGAMLRAAFPGRQSWPVTRLAFASSGWPGNRRGATYWLDNVEIASPPGVNAAIPPAPAQTATVADRKSPDKEPPPAPVVSYFPSEALFVDTFERDTGMFGDFVSGQALRRAEGGATGPGCVELRDLGLEGGRGYVLVRDLNPDWPRFPLIRLQYRVEPPGPAASLILRGTTFDGTTDYWTPLGTFPGDRSGWQTAVVDIPKALAASPGLTLHRLFLDIAVANPDGVILVDDCVMYSPKSIGARFAWGEPADVSGLRGYSWLLDHSDTTMPTERITGSGREAKFANLAPGHWCFHVRACDRAGNWGPAAHVPFERQ
jgi:hypothetical protein